MYVITINRLWWHHIAGALCYLCSFRMYNVIVNVMSSVKKWYSRSIISCQQELEQGLHAPSQSFHHVTPFLFKKLTTLVGDADTCCCLLRLEVEGTQRDREFSWSGSLPLSSSGFCLTTSTQSSETTDWLRVRRFGGGADGGFENGELAEEGRKFFFLRNCHGFWGGGGGSDEPFAGTTE